MTLSAAESAIEDRAQAVPSKLDQITMIVEASMSADDVLASNVGDYNGGLVIEPDAWDWA